MEKICVYPCPDCGNEQKLQKVTKDEGVGELLIAIFTMKPMTRTATAMAAKLPNFKLFLTFGLSRTLFS